MNCLVFLCTFPTSTSGHGAQSTPTWGLGSASQACPGALLFESQSSSNHLQASSSVSSSGWCWLVLHPEAAAFIHCGSGCPSQPFHCCLTTLHLQLLQGSINCCHVAVDVRSIYAPHCSVLCVSEIQGLSALPHSFVPDLFTPRCGHTSLVQQLLGGMG